MGEIYGVAPPVYNSGTIASQSWLGHSALRKKKKVIPCTLFNQINIIQDDYHLLFLDGLWKECDFKQIHVHFTLQVRAHDVPEAHKAPFNRGTLKQTVKQ